MTIQAPIRRAIPADATVSTWSAPDGWRLRRFDWPQRERPARGAILFQGGRGDVFEKYLESFGHWHDAGWSVTSLDWRGQGGSGRLSNDAHVGHAEDFDLWISDLASFWREWDAVALRVAIGHSMGGHLILRALTEQAIRPDSAVLVAPMLGLKAPLGAVIGERIARFMRARGDPARAAWKKNERPGLRPDRQTLLTHDATRYADEQYWFDRSPEIKLGPPSWAWLTEAFASTRTQRADPRLGSIDTPVLMLVAEADGLVDAKAAIMLAERLPNAELLRFGRESAHEILREADPVRNRALEAIDRFLTTNAS
ncbi:alpha/beta hydrolase [Sphingomonas sp. SUN019]|uniref:alpha/beta fold hydrolase n=1 Tax=Sphingomonas sp. SUN019 TaxID=2937788 RepID=UPI002164981B|nr:alpha/beta hydrolase [Sphingomonas sp. SUN019]UVO49810.1 alpha/beta hydrolase [Sphingomonas sp. SUN019]